MNDPIKQLWPPVRQWDASGGTISAQQLEHISVSRNKDLPIQGYRLFVSDAPRIEARDDDGERCARATLAQLQQHAHLAAGCISDWPETPLRGVMLDVSRDRIPTMAELRRIIRDLAAAKANHLQLYTEHSFAYQAHAPVWQMASPLTAAEIRDLDRYAQHHGITLVANQNGFGHMERWLRHSTYAQLAERPDARERILAGDPLPFSLNPQDPRSLNFALSLYDELLPNFQSNMVNIGCDETWDVGQGQSKAAVARDGFARVYGNFVGALSQQLQQQHGAKSLFWADMALDHPEALSAIPQDAIALAWCYEPGDHFKRWGPALRQAGFEWWACPGTSSWNSFGGRSDARLGSIAAAVHDGLAEGASGIVMTDWGDFGHRQQWPISWYGMAEGLGAAWNATALQDAGREACGHFCFGSATAGRWLHELGLLDATERAQVRDPKKDRPLINRDCLFTDSQRPLQDRSWLPEPALWHCLAEKISDLRSCKPTVADALINDEISHALDCAESMCARALARRGAISQQKQAENITALAQRHRSLWLQRSRPGGLADSCAHWLRLAQQWQRFSP